jgi:hypothetical protein
MCLGNGFTNQDDHVNTKDLQSCGNRLTVRISPLLRGTGFPSVRAL